jgi:hypothetical protein
MVTVTTMATSFLHQLADARLHSQLRWQQRQQLLPLEEFLFVKQMQMERIHRSQLHKIH